MSSSQISASVPPETVKEINAIMAKESTNPSFSQMVATLLSEAVEARKSPKTKK